MCVVAMLPEAQCGPGASFCHHHFDHPLIFRSYRLRVVLGMSMLHFAPAAGTDVSERLHNSSSPALFQLSRRWLKRRNSSSAVNPGGVKGTVRTGAISA